MTALESVIIGVVGSLIATALLASSVRVRNFFSKRLFYRQERKFWKHHAKQNIKVVLTTREGEDRRSTLKVSLNEVQAFSNLKMTIHNLKQHLSLVSVLNPSISDLTDAPFISIGGPAKNALTQSILDKLKGRQPVQFDDTTSNLHVGGEEYIPTIDNTGMRNKDYGVIIRLSKANGNEYDCIIAMGCHGFGTEAAAKAITDKEMLKKLNSEHGDKDFVQVVRTEISNRKIITSELMQGFSLNKK